MSALASSRKIRIAGGGVGGLALGVGLAKRGVDVTVFDKGAYPRHRVCGEFICGVREETLEKLGLTDLFEPALRHTSTAWMRGMEEVLRADLPFSALGMSRYMMDLRMAEALQDAGGELHSKTGLALDAEDCSDGVVWATGRQRERGEWLGLKVHCLDFALSANLEIYLGSQAYVGASAVENSRVNVCGLFRRVPGMRGREIELMYAYLEKAGLSGLKAKIQRSTPDMDSYCGISHFSFESGLGWKAKAPEQDAIFSIGDQWGVIPPFTGNGMSIAMETAAIALDPLTDYSRGQRTWDEAVSLFKSEAHRHLKTRFRIANMIQPILLNPKAQQVLTGAAKRNLLPFKPLFALTHGA